MSAADKLFSFLLVDYLTTYGQHQMALNSVNFVSDRAAG